MSRHVTVRQLPDGSVRIRFPYDPALVTSLKSSLRSRRWDPDAREWIVAAYEADAALAWAEGRPVETPSVRSRTSLDSIMERFPHLREYQAQAVHYACLHDWRCFLADEMGLGKTVEALAAVEMANAYPALVACPMLGGLGPRHWAAQARRYLPQRSVSILDTKDGSLRIGSEEIPLNDPSADILVVNYDKLPIWTDIQDRTMTIEPGTVLAQVASRLGAIVCDEAHYLKSSHSHRSRAMYHLSRGVPVRLLLTGTPILNTPADLIQPLRILDRLHEIGGWRKYTQRYCAARQTPWGLDISGASHLDELAERLAQICYIGHRRADVLDELPAREEILLVCDLANGDEYHAAERDVISWILEHKGEWKAEAAARAKALVQLNTLRQIAARGKLVAVMEQATEIAEEGHKVVVWAWHQEIQRKLAETLKAGLLTGGQDGRNADIAHRFQTDPSQRILVASLAAAKEGIELTAAHHCVFAELPWRPADLDQAEARMYARLSDMHGLMAYYVLGDCGIDETMWSTISRKRRVASAVQDTASEVLEALASRTMI